MRRIYSLFVVLLSWLRVAAQALTIRQTLLHLLPPRRLRRQPPTYLRHPLPRLRPRRHLLRRMRRGLLPRPRADCTAGHRAAGDAQRYG